MPKAQDPPGASRRVSNHFIGPGSRDVQSNTTPATNNQAPLSAYVVDRHLTVFAIRHRRPSRKLIDLAFRGFAP